MEINEPTLKSVMLLIFRNLKSIPKKKKKISFLVQMLTLFGGSKIMYYYLKNI